MAAAAQTPLAQTNAPTGLKPVLQLILLHVAPLTKPVQPAAPPLAMVVVGGFTHGSAGHGENHCDVRKSVKQKMQIVPPQTGWPVHALAAHVYVPVSIKPASHVGEHVMPLARPAQALLMLPCGIVGGSEGQGLPAI